MTDQPNLPDIDHGIDALTETTTPAELMKSRGQRTKLKTINRDKLKQWMEAALMQAIAGREGHFDDSEKEAMLRAMQVQFDEMAARASKAESAIRDREQRAMALTGEIEQLRAVQANAATSSEELEKALHTIEALTKQREELAQESDDLRADLYQVQDQLAEKMALLRTTIEEKDRLKGTMQDLMVRAGELNNGVLGLDNDYYAGRHQAEHHLAEDASQEQVFFHDFDVGTTVIASLATDLARLREISRESHEGNTQQGTLLAEDLALLERLRDSGIRSSDIAEPVANLVEALEGARDEALAQAEAAGAVMGIAGQDLHLSPLPDHEGEAAVVLAGATQAVRELAAAFAQAKGRLAAIKAMTDDAEEARNQADSELQSLQEAQARLLAAVAERAEVAQLVVPETLADTTAPADQRLAAAEALVSQFGTGRAISAEVQEDLEAIEVSLLQAEQSAPPSRVRAELRDESGEQIAGLDVSARLQARCARLLSQLDQERVAAERLRQREAALLSLLAAASEQRAAVDPAAAEQAQRLQRVITAETIDDDETQAMAEAAVRILAAQPQGALSASFAQELVQIAQQDSVLASQDMVADLAVAAESGAASLDEPAQAVVQALGARRSALEAEVAELTSRLEAAELTQAQTMAEVEQQQQQLQQALAQAQEQTKAAQAKALQHEKRLQQELRAAQERLDALQTAAQEHQAAERQSSSALAQQLVELARRDAALAGLDAVADLAVTVERDEQHPAAQAQAVLAALGERHQAMDRELADLRSRLASAEALQAEREQQAAEWAAQREELERERNDMAESGREVITQLTAQKEAREQELASLRERVSGLDQVNREYIESTAELAELARAVLSTRDDDNLRGAVDALDQALSAMPGDSEVAIAPDKALAMVSATQALAQSLKTAYEGAVAETTEMAASGKEIIELLTEKNHRLSEEHSAQAEQVRGLQARVKTLEQADRHLLESIATLAGSVGSIPEIEDARADLELSLSGDVVTKDQALDTARSARALVEALASSGLGAKKDGEIAELRHQLEEAQSLRVASENKAAETAERLAQAEAQLLAQAESLGGQIAALEAQLAQHSAAEARFASEAAGSGQALDSLKAEHEIVSKELVDLKQVLESKNVSLRHLRDENAAAMADRDHLREEIARLQARLSEEQETQRTQTAEREAAIEAELSALQETIEQTRVSLAERGAELSATLSALEAAQQAQQESAQQRDILQKDLAELQEDSTQALAERRAEAERLAAELAELTADAEVRQAELEQVRSGAQQVEAALQAQIEQLQSALAQSQGQAESQRETSAALRSELTQSQQQQAKLGEELATVQGLAQEQGARLSQLEHDATQLRAQLTQTRQQAVQASEQVADLSEEADRLRGLLKQARAALEEYRTREEEERGGTDGRVAHLREQLNQAQRERERFATQASDALEDARIELTALRKQLSELQQGLLARDEQILELQNDLDQRRAQEVHAGATSAQVARLSADLQAATQRVQDLEQQVAALTAEESRAGGLAGELNRLQAERETLLAKGRSLEDELALERGRVSGLKEAREKQRSEQERERAELMSKLSAEVEARDLAEQNLVKLKAELSGLQARLRKLTSSDEDFMAPEAIEPGTKTQTHKRKKAT